MTLFEYIAVAVSIVLSFGAVRLLDGLPQTLDRSRSFGPQTFLVINLLWLHVHFWWIFWSYHDVETWTYPKFLFALIAPGLLYSMAGTTIPRDPGAVRSWEEHYFAVRVRFFTLVACFIFALAVSGWLIRDMPVLHRVRFVQIGAIAVCLAGALSDSRVLHRLIGPIATAGLVLVTTALGLGLL